MEFSEFDEIEALADGDLLVLQQLNSGACFRLPLSKLKAYLGTGTGTATAAKLDLNAVVMETLPTHYYKLDEISGTVAIDSSGNSKNGSYLGGYQLGQSSSLANSKSVLFNGSTGYIKVTGASAPSGSTARSMMALIYTGAQIKDSTLISIGGAGSGQQFIWQIGGYLFTDGVNSSNNVALNASENPPLNSWSLLHFVFSANAYRFFINGNIIRLGTFSSGINTVGGDLFIGNRSDNVANFANFQFDAVAVWNKALSDSEVAKQYQAYLDSKV